MKISIPLALTGLGVLLAISCAAETDGSGAKTGEASTLPPHFDPAHPPVAFQDTETLQAEKQERTAFDESLAGSGEAIGEPVPSELQRQLEAEYQAALKRTDEQNSRFLHVHGDSDFDALFEKIRTTMPPQREALLIQYVMATRSVHDATRQKELLQRLSSPELNNVR